MDPELEKLLRQANEAFEGMTPEEKKRALTRDQIAELYDAREALRASQRAMH